MNLTERYMEMQRWPASRKTFAFALMFAGGHLVLWLQVRELAGQVSQPGAHALATTALLWFWAIVACGAASGIASWRGHAAPWLAHVFAVVHATFMLVVINFGLGVLALSWVPLTALLFAFCFDERVGATMLVTSLLLAALLSVVPIPLLDVPPLAGSAQYAVEQLTGQLVAALVIVNFLLCALVLSAQRVLEQRVHAANRLIRRYLPGQLADRILAGGHGETTKHERRKLTIFFSDVAGFTNLSDEQDAEELAGVLNEYLSEMTGIADRFGATINQLVGDGIMIFFGAPTATDDRDHALRAVRMAHEMQRRMVELREAWFRRGIQHPFRIRIGINTGFASVGDFGSPGRMMYSAIGQQTNLAARIQAHCEPDRILLSHSTWALVQDEIACTPKGELQVKGLHYPVLVYEVAPA